MQLLPLALFRVVGYGCAHTVIRMELMLKQLEAARARGFHVAACVVQACLKMAVGDQGVPADLHRWNTALKDWEVADQDGEDDSDESAGGEGGDGRGDGDGDGDDHPGGNDSESGDDDEYRAADDDEIESSQPSRSWRRSAQKEKVVWEMPVGGRRSPWPRSSVSAGENAAVSV